uniref:RNA-directed DNA polymerase n=1 Tax=Fagus sylvatica TaxID=28930 RepID=A0A2N9H8H7_FAGSY
MASTRSTTPEDRFSALEVSTHSLHRKLEEYHEEISGVRDGMAALTEAVAQLNRDRSTRNNLNDNNDGGSVNHGHGAVNGNHNEGNNRVNHGGVQTRFSRLDFPRFNGDDPTGWIYKADQFFRYQGTIAQEKVLLASFHLQDDALQWYQWYARSQPNVRWEEFTQALCVRFGPSDYEDFDEALSRLRQTGTVREYQGQFERLAARVQDWPEKALLGCYIGGLKEDIRAEVKLFRPTTLLHATGLARLQEDRLYRLRRPPTKPPLLALPPTRPSPNTINRVPTGTNFKKLSWGEMQARREKGLCYNCDEKFAPGHRCKTQQIYMLEVVGEHESESDETAEEEANETTLQPEISLHALTGADTPDTMRVSGWVHGKKLHILIDSGSTHNFINSKIAKKLGCRTISAPTFHVEVANGERLSCNEIYQTVPMDIQGYAFVTHLFQLDLQGSDIVLGMQWLRSLGQVLHDWANLTMEFSANGQPHLIKGNTPQKLRHGSTHAMQKLLSSGVGSFLMHMVAVTDHNIDPPKETKHAVALDHLLVHYQSVFQTPTELPPVRSHDHRITLEPGSGAINVRPYRYPHIQKNEILKEQALNHVTIKDRYPIPVIDELLDELHGAAYFTKLDLKSGYHQIRVQPEDVHKTAFRTHDGHYEFLVMPFGLTNTPATFQSLMNDIFRTALRRYVLVFFDDILIYSHTWAEHLQHLQIVFDELLRHKLYVNRSKCLLGQQEVDYLGHIISPRGVAPDPSKINCMQSWPQPRNTTALRGFLGLTGYYRKFVQNYGIIAAPLTQLLKKDGFKWSDAATEAFQQLKSAMVQAPVLVLPNFAKTFVVEADASGGGLGAVLMQGDRPIAFYSKAISLRALGRSTYEKELMAIVHSVHKWRNYLLGRRFQIRTDHRSLKYLLEQRVTTMDQQRWIVKLMGFDYEIVYRPGRDNKAADALSRLHGALVAISSPQHAWLTEIHREARTHSEIVALKEEIIQQSKATSGFTERDGLVWYQGRLVIPATSQYNTHVIREYHDTPIGGHSGRNKYETMSPAGLLQPLPIPELVWEDVSMDFIDGLPNSHGFTVIMVVVDRLTKYAHFLSLKHPYTAKVVAELYVKEISRLHGMPRSIVTDRDKVFTSQFWTEYFRLQGSELRMSSAYHPQTDGQTEALNKCLETYLRCFVSTRQKQWSRWLHWAEFWYNTSYQTSTRLTPFEAVYGRPPPSVHRYEYGSTAVAQVDNSLRERDNILQLLKENLVVAQNRMKTNADKHRREQEFDVGQWVYLKLQPFRQNSVRDRGKMKLSPRFYGPYQLKLKLGASEGVVEELPSVSEDGVAVLESKWILEVRWVKIGRKTVQEALVHWTGLSSDDATWERFSDLERQFPHLNLEDKIRLQGEENVTTQLRASDKDAEVVQGLGSASVAEYRG